MIPATDSGSFLDLVGNFATDPVHRLVHRVVEMLLLRQSFSLPNRGLRGGGRPVRFRRSVMCRGRGGRLPLRSPDQPGAAIFNRRQQSFRTAEARPRKVFLVGQSLSKHTDILFALHSMHRSG